MGLFQRVFPRARRSPEDRFAHQVLDVIQPQVAEAWYEPDGFAIAYRRTDADGVGRVFLHNTFRECVGTGWSERSARINNLVSAVVGSTLEGYDWAHVAPMLRPVLRGLGFGQTSGGDEQTTTKAMLSRPCLPYIAELVVVDLPMSMAYVNTAHVQEWGVSVEEVFETARHNLAALASEVTPSGRSGTQTVLNFEDPGGSYFTSMLLVEGFLAGLAPWVGGRPVAFAPDRNRLIVVADQPKLVCEMLAVAENQFAEAPRSLSPAPYTVDASGSLVAYVPAEPGEVADRVHRAEVLLAAGAYQSQKESLDAAHERAGSDIFVGSLIVASKENGSAFSVAVWPDECDTLLPEADLVCFDSGAQMVLVPWPVVARLSGLRPEPGQAPARFRVTAWPAAPVMDQLRAEAVTP